MAEIKDCRVTGFTADRDRVIGPRGQTMGFTHGTVTLEIMLPPGMDQLLPPGFAERRITIIVEPTPGEAAYLKHTAGALDRPLAWERLDSGTREHWERVAQAAIKAR